MTAIVENPQISTAPPPIVISTTSSSEALVQEEACIRGMSVDQYLTSAKASFKQRSNLTAADADSSATSSF